MNSTKARLLTRIVVLASVFLVVGIGTALAVRPSGPGQNTSANSLSVVVASDQTVSVAQSEPTIATAITKSDTADTSSLCTKGFVVTNDAGVSNVTVVGTGTDAGINDAGQIADAAYTAQFQQVASGTRVPGKYQRIMSTGTTATGVVCFSGP